MAPPRLAPPIVKLDLSSIVIFIFDVDVCGSASGYVQAASKRSQDSTDGSISA